jgi:hypothetical protein
VAVLPSWLQRLPQTGGAIFYAVLGQFYGASPRWWVVAIVLVCAALGRGLRRRNPALIHLAVLTLAAAVAVVLTVAQIPGADALEMTYLSVIFFPIGILTWCCIGYLVWTFGSDVLRVHSSRPVNTDNAADAVRLVAAAALVALSVLSLVTTVDRIPSQESLFGGPSAEVMTERVVNFVQGHVSKDEPVGVRVDAPQPLDANSVQMGAAYQLYVDGWHVRFLPGLGNQIGAGVIADTPLVMVRCDVVTRTCARLAAQGVVGT